MVKLEPVEGRCPLKLDQPNTDQSQAMLAHLHHAESEAKQLPVYPSVHRHPPKNHGTGAQEVAFDNATLETD